MNRVDYKKLAIDAKTLYILVRDYLPFISEEKRGRVGYLAYRLFLRYERRLLLLYRAGGCI